MPQLLLLGKDPAEQSVKLNDVHGEEGLYLRLHTLDMFANRRLTLMDDSRKLERFVKNEY